MWKHWLKWILWIRKHTFGTVLIKAQILKEKFFFNLDASQVKRRETKIKEQLKNERKYQWLIDIALISKDSIFSCYVEMLITMIQRIKL